MLFIKEVVPFDLKKDQVQGSRIIIRTNTYGSNFAFFQKLFDEANKDFPFITPENADIKHYGGQRYKHTYGIEFNVKLDVHIPSDYRQIQEVEYTL